MANAEFDVHRLVGLLPRNRTSNKFDVVGSTTRRMGRRIRVKPPGSIPQMASVAGLVKQAARCRVGDEDLVCQRVGEQAEALLRIALSARVERTCSVRSSAMQKMSGGPPSRSPSGSLRTTR